MLQIFFTNTLRVFDYKNMHMNYWLDDSVDDVLAGFFILQGLLPKPMGVQLGVLIYAPLSDNFFGFRTYSQAAYHSSPFNTYSSYNMSAPWLNKSDVLYV
jgi:hypothetical protein